MKIAVTGANGYIGASFVRRCLDLGHEVIACSRSPEKQGSTPHAARLTHACTSDGVPSSSMLQGCDRIVHLAGRAHNFNAPDADDALFEWSNHQLALRVAESALQAGIQRMIQVSTVSVHGNWSDLPVSEDTPLQAMTPYAVSKMAAEVSLTAFCKETGMELFIVRPPLVYGPACPGNFFRLVRLVRSGLPLPLQAVTAQRSFIHVDNLVDFLRHCLFTGQDEHVVRFVIGDGSDWLMPDLVRRIATELGITPRLMKCHPEILRFGARLTGRRKEMDSITRSLLVDWKAARSTGWRPVLDADAAFRQTMLYYRSASS